MDKEQARVIEMVVEKMKRRRRKGEEERAFLQMYTMMSQPDIDVTQPSFSSLNELHHSALFLSVIDKLSTLVYPTHYLHTA